jgi:2'-5' RNA ligase
VIRLFVGLELPIELRAGLAALRLTLDGARWLDVAGMHLTLRFVGEVDEPMAEEIDHALAAIDAPAFELRLAGVGRFATHGQVRALWAGAEKSAALEGLRNRVEGGCRKAGLDAEGRKFLPHVTLARGRHLGEREAARFLEAHAGFCAAPVTIDHVALFSSSLGHAGANYRTEARYRLAGAVADDMDTDGADTETG